MAKKQKQEGLTNYLLMIGLCLAVLAAIVEKLFRQDWIMWPLAVFGVLLGIWNITEKESTPFLVATVAILALQGMTLGQEQHIVGVVGGLLDQLQNMLARFIVSLGMLMGPAALIVALKEIWVLAKD